MNKQNWLILTHTSKDAVLSHWEVSRGTEVGPFLTEDHASYHGATHACLNALLNHLSVSLVTFRSITTWFSPQGSQQTIHECVGACVCWCEIASVPLRSERPHFWSLPSSGWVESCGNWKVHKRISKSKVNGWMNEYTNKKNKQTMVYFQNTAT